MRRLFIPAIAAFAAVAFIPTRPTVAAQTTPALKITLDKAGLAPEVQNDQRTALAAAPGHQFLWITATGAGAPGTIDLTKVTLTSGGTTSPLLGVDAMWDGDPKAFSMIAPAHLKTGAAVSPLEESKSAGSIAFAFTPGKTATVKVNSTPQSFCLLFDVPAAFAGGQVSGLAAQPLPVPKPAGPGR